MSKKKIKCVVTQDTCPDYCWCLFLTHVCIFIIVLLFLTLHPFAYRHTRSTWESCSLMTVAQGKRIGMAVGK